MNDTATVLFVNDDPGVADTTAACVERASDALVTTTATTTEAALELVEESDIDCVVSGHNAPVMNGLALYKAVAERESGIPFILFTDEEHMGIASEAFSLGITDYLHRAAGSEQYEVLANRVEHAIEARRTEQRLERYERLVETIDDALYTVDSEGEFTFVNDSFVTLTGYDRDELLDSDVSILKDAETVELFENSVRELLGDNHDETYLEFDLWTADGERIPCEDHMVLRTDNGAYTGVSGVIRDITDRTEHERDLERYETAVEAAPVGVYVLDAEGTISWCNERAGELVGHSVADLTGDPFVSLIEEGIVPETAIANYEAVLSDLLSEESDRTTGQYDITITPPETSERTLRIHISLLPYDEEFRGAVLVSEDITERRQRERERERQHDRLSALFENISDAVYRYEYDGEEGRIQAVNPAFESIFGYDEAEVVGDRISEAIVPADSMAEYRDIAAQAEAGDPVNVEIERETATGRRTFLLRNASITEAGEDDPIAGYAIYTDITERKQREERLATQAAAMDTSIDGIVIIDDEGEFTYVNEAYAAMHDYDEPDDLIGRPWRTLYPEKERERIENEILPAFGPNDFWRGEAIGRRADGTTFPHELSITRVDENRLVGVVRDITDRKERKRALERERERFATLFRNIPDPTVLVDHAEGELIVESINDAFEATFGYPAETAVGEPLNDLVVPPEKHEEAAAIDGAVIGGEQIVRELTRRTADGENREFLFRNATLDGEASESFGVYTDITTQKRRERVLADLHEWTRKMMDATEPAAVASIAVETAERVLDLSVCALWLYDEDTGTLRPTAMTDDSDATIGNLPTYEPGNSLSWDAFVNGDARTYDDVSEADVYNPETSIRSEMILPLGEYGVMNVGTTTIGEFDDTDEALARLLATNVEAALERAERERERAAQRQLLEQQNDRLEEFASTVSHDLRNPLNVASGRLELLREDTDSQHAQPIVDALERMDDLIEECLMFARQGQLVTDPIQVDIETIAERAWQTVDTEDTTLTVDDLRTVKADEERLRTLFENLFHNAILHGDATAVQIGPLEDGPGFYVADDGSGIPESEHETVFDRGYSTSETGTGLGLSIVEAIADAHGWEIVLAEGNETGSRFEVRITPPRSGYNQLGYQTE
ncbi:PAS domain S-box protein [Saliphagus infecundisoli]|uniref:histidine kinase n=1 Tax=Saliphagus infecundisoli TaxID=1849069 RepID=A0ABD5QEF6_9EURY|nr:PAS domain S-box protein [Saliphagus infecundisoli]